MSLEVKVQRARDLLNVDRIGASDPYVNVEFRGKKQKTSVVKDNLNPGVNQLLTTAEYDVNVGRWRRTSWSCLVDDRQKKNLRQR